MPLNIAPSEVLSITCHPTTPGIGLLRMETPSAQRYAFKIQTTAVRDYAVKPAMGIVQPSTVTSVAISRAAGAPVVANCADKFKVQWVEIEEGVGSASDALFAGAGVQ
jgi:hypothetical protein